jgi:tetraacyldisaccharide 4'-kinase
MARRASALNRPDWWQAHSLLACAWLPLGVFFFMLAGLRRFSYRLGLAHSRKLTVPVVVVGNIAVGGSGKTPVVIWLANALRENGWQPGIVSRGYEPILLARRTACPLWIGRDRFLAGQALLAAHPEVNIILTDDGLQHYGLYRDAEIVVIDDAILGNQWPMPAGPLREPMSRLAHTTLIIAHGELSASTRQKLPTRPCVDMRLLPGRFYRLDDPSLQCDASTLVAQPLHALAGIARPERFFDTLRSLGLSLQSTRALPDHYAFTPEDLDRPDGEVLLITEKDAVKCSSFSPRNVWVLPVEAHIEKIALDYLLECLHGPETA